MSFLDRIAECNRHDPARYTPFRVDGRVVGRVRCDRAGALAECSGLAAAPGGCVAFVPGLAGVWARTEAFNGAVRAMAERGWCGPWRGESYPVGARFGEALCEVDRSGAELFGVPAYGVHLSGYVETGGGVSLWIARRSRSVRVCPGQFDNLAAGGQPAGLGSAENLAKEAGIPAALAARAVRAGTVTYGLDSAFGIRRGVMFVFDLALPEDFRPENRDGEVEEFHLWPMETAMRRVAETRDFKFDLALTLIDFLLRRGAIPPDRPDYAAVRAGLHCQFGGWRGCAAQVATASSGPIIPVLMPRR